MQEHLASEVTRNIEGLRSKWGEIQRDVQKFIGCMKKVECGGTSGMVHEDKVNNAKRMFEETVYTLEKGEKKSKKFIYYSCWLILKDSQKFTVLYHQKRTVLLLASY